MDRARSAHCSPQKLGVFLLIVKSVLPLVLLIGAVSCKRNFDATSSEPNAVLKHYIDLSFEAKSVKDKTALAELLTGSARDRLMTWSDEQFLSAFVNSKRELIKFAVHESKRISAKEASITYELVSTEGKGTPTETRQTQKKLAMLAQTASGGWQIKEVRNIKTLTEFKNEMTLP